MRIASIDLRRPGADHWATAIRKVHLAAYAQEARLLGFEDVREFPPLQRSIESLRASNERYFAEIDDAVMVGVIGIEPAEIPGAFDGPTWAGERLPIGESHIASLAVQPSYQRRGIASRLLEAAIEAHGSAPISVSTSPRNEAAIALYHRFGFARWRTKAVTWRSPLTGAMFALDLMLLRREPG